jgi:hypothetical protein
MPITWSPYLPAVRQPMPFAGDKEFGVNFTDAATCAGYQDRLTD